MSATDNRPSIATATPTIAALLGISPPSSCHAPVLERIVAAANAAFDGRRAARLLVFAPDAFGDCLEESCPSVFSDFRDARTVSVPLRAELPPKTPVCYASIFTGARPSVHGIAKYEKPVLKCDTLFDALSRAGRKAAIVAVEGASMDRIFRERPIDYFSEEYDSGVTNRTVALLCAGVHDFIVSYVQAYDDSLHRTGPFAAASLQAARATAAKYSIVRTAFDRYWSAYDRVLIIAPDHGGHATPTGGDHSDDTPGDMHVNHFYRLTPAGQ